jgi:Cytochrome bd terminal oxidase subunit I
MRVKLLTAMAALSTTLPALWIMVNNSWMQVPVGYATVNGNGGGGMQAHIDGHGVVQADVRSPPMARSHPPARASRSTENEALLCGGKDVYLAGGGNSTGPAVMHLAKHARSVTMLVRGKALAVSMYPIPVGTDPRRRQRAGALLLIRTD